MIYKLKEYKIILQCGIRPGIVCIIVLQPRFGNIWLFWVLCHAYHKIPRSWVRPSGSQVVGATFRVPGLESHLCDGCPRFWVPPRVSSLRFHFLDKPISLDIFMQKKLCQVKYYFLLEAIVALVFLGMSKRLEYFL